MFIVLMGSISLLPLPDQMFSVLSGITGYGCWVLGADMFLLVSACISGWFVIKITVGLVIFVWDLLPLT